MAALAAASVTGCGVLVDSPEVDSCERYVKTNLDNPQSYDRLDHVSLAAGQFWQVDIVYTVENEDGTRSGERAQTCDFVKVDGEPDPNRMIAADPEL